ncbi:MAG: bifunctional adenosylcobinamide kinase/adenosylcobinamide-phosphate guanylyltransferase [Hyphomicrobiaceae bacterium]|nr:bifunctional adenosylcobinamide kinase/adenosylcobinamide-phosphate guanylyltransferase [Hyphomicrobiaceae bacterium]
MPTPQPTPPLPRLTLVLGGARSGKSTYAENLLRDAPIAPLVIVTAEAHDDEMRARIAKHKSDRDPTWQTREAPIKLPAIITEESQTARPILVDCLTLWLSNLLLIDADLDRATADLIAAVQSSNCPIVLVSNEVGLGIVPDNALARRFRDAQGRLNQRLAQQADHVVFIAAGLPLTLK